MQQSRLTLNKLEKTILTTLNQEQTKYDIPLTLQELNTLVSKLTNTSYQGTKYSAFKNAIQTLEKHAFIKLEKQGAKIITRLTPTGKTYLEHGDTVKLSPIFLFYTRISFITTPFLIYCILIGIYAYMYNKIWIFLESPFYYFFLASSYVIGYYHVHYLLPALKNDFGINVKQLKYQVSHPLITALLNNNLQIKRKTNQAFIISFLLAFLNVLVLYYLHLLNGLNTPGIFGIPVNHSMISLVYNIIIVPFIMFFLGFYYYLTLLITFWFLSLPFSISKESFQNLKPYFKSLCKYIRVYILAIQLVLLIIIITAMKLGSPFYNAEILSYSLLTVLSSLVFIFTIVFLSHKKIKNP